MKDFWQKLNKPFFVLAPMEDVTDAVFRKIVAGTARPDVFFTEFTNVDGLMSAGRNKLIRKFEYTDDARPIIAQVWGLKPENYYQVSKQIVEMGFDGIDINMGCPEKDVLKAGACAALINNRELAGEIIAATKEGAGDLPVSIKTRIGVKAIQTEDWLGFVLEQGVECITVHGRTAAELSKVPAHWEEIARVVRLRDSMSKKTVIVGNGDVQNRQHGLELIEKFGVDGVMVGRGIFANLWAFDEKGHEAQKSEKIAKAIDHVKLFQEVWEGQKNPQILKKFFKVYINGFEGASELRVRLMETRNYPEMLSILNSEQ